MKPCSRPSFLRKQESSPTPRPLEAGSKPALDLIRGPA